MNSHCKSPDVILKMAGTSIEEPQGQWLALWQKYLPLSPAELLFWALHMFCLCFSRSIPEDENHNVVLKMITSFSVFQQPLQYIIHFLIPDLIYAKLCLVSKSASSYFLVFRPQLSYFACHSIYNQLSMCQKATSTACVKSAILFIHLNGLLLRNKEKKRPKWLWPWITFNSVSVGFFSIIKLTVKCIFFLLC